MPAPRIYRRFLPLARLYGWGVALRNMAFDCGWLKQRAFPLPVICVGNLAVGGTGKTPHTELVVRLLQEHCRVAVLSRGYRRKRRGFVLADAHTTADDIGDEPLQIHRKFPQAVVAACADRAEGIERLMALDKPRVEAVVLDDAFQHRHVKPGLSILLTTYDRLYTDDRLLPAGRLREPAEGMARATFVVVTKCPHTPLTPIERRMLRRKLGIKPYQTLFLTTYRYGSPYPLFAPAARWPERPDVLLLTGIAHPEALHRHAAAGAASVTPLRFADHHAFSAADVRRINAAFAALPPDAVCLTTEKDAARLRSTPGLSDALRQKLWVQPVEVDFVDGHRKLFSQKLIQYVETHRRN